MIMDSKHQDNELASALLQWVNSFDSAKKIQSWQDLEDGTTLWRILRKIDPEYFYGDLPEVDRKQKGTTDNWIPRWQNLKHIDRVAGAYIRDECEQLPYLSKSLNPDLKAVATNGSPENIIKLVKAVLLAAMYSETSDEKALIVEKVGLQGASAIADAIQDMEELDQKLGEMETEPETSSEVDNSTDSELPAHGKSYDRDPDLEREERLIRALQEKRKLEEKLEYLDEDLKESQEKCRSLEEELQESKFGNRQRRTTIDEENLQKLNLQADRDRDYIVKLETDLAENNSTLDQQQRQIERLKSDGQSKQELRDELQLIMTERDELRQKTKANENLKKKIHALQEQERVCANLKKELQSAHEQLSEVENWKDRCVALEKANEENAKTIANGEQEIFDQKTAKEQLKYEMKVLAQRYEQTKEMLTSAQEMVRELEDGTREARSDDGSPGGVDDLDAELNAEAGLAEGSKTTRRKSVLPTQSADTIVLQQDLSIAKTTNARLEQKCLDLLQENLGYKSVLEDKDGASEHPFQHQTRRLEGLEKEMDDLQGKYLASTTESADLRRLLELSESQAYDERRHSADEAIAQNRERQKFTDELQIQLREHRGLLRHALLNADGLQKEAEDSRTANEYKLVRQQLDIVRSASIEDTENVVTNTATSITNRIESVRKAVDTRDARIQEVEAQLAALKSNQDKQKSLPPEPSNQTSREAQQEIANLQRENRLMASAWHDLTSRLQSNTVLLTRRQEAPKSWLGKQRAAVGRR